MLQDNSTVRMRATDAVERIYSGSPRISAAVQYAPADGDRPAGSAADWLACCADDPPSETYKRYLCGFRACLVKNESAANAPKRPHFPIIFVK